MNLLIPFRRITSNGSYFAEIDGLRFIAITSVFVYHLAGYVAVKSGGSYPATSPFWPLAFGVQVFFAISGFVLASPFVNYSRRPSTREYLLRRVRRIEPPYLINTLLVAAIAGLHPVWPLIGAALTYSNGLIFGRTNPLSVVTWSLEIEIQFYLLAPLLFRCFRVSARRRRALLILLGAAFVSLQLLFPSERLRLSLAGQAQYFLAGVFLADLNYSRKHPAFDAGALLSWLALYMCIRHEPLLTYSGAILIVSAFYCSLRGPMMSWFLSRPPIYTIGGMCYTIYLYHYFAISAFGRVLLPLTGTSLLVIGPLIAVFTLILSAVLYLLTEKPFMKRHWWRVRRERALPATATS